MPERFSALASPIHQLTRRALNVGKGDAPAIEYQSAYLAKLRDGKIAYWRPYQSHAEALEAVGLPEQDAHAGS
jgi:hypothetical protein